MDNYLAPRWPKGAPENRSAAVGKRPAGRGRRIWRDLLIVAAALVLLGGLTAASFFGVQYAAERLADAAAQPTESNWPDSLLPDDYQDRFTEQPSRGALDLPRTEPDPAVQLSLQTQSGREVLSAPEIYVKVLPSIVYVEAVSGDGYHVGSGIVVTESGYIITNYHILDGCYDVQILRLSDGAQYDAAVVGFDEELDLAVLKADGDGFTAAELGNSDELRVGDPVYAIGNPMGYLMGSMSDGIVSALAERTAELDYPGRLIQTTAALNQGNSGGALVDAYGRVVGITYAKVTGVREDVVIEGIGLAIPLADAQPYLNRILRTGQTARVSVGIMCRSQVVDGRAGIYVVEVTKGTPAWSKLLEGDLIIAANGVSAATVDDLTRLFNLLDPGDTVELTVIRRGREVTVTVELYDRLAVEAAEEE